MTNNQMTNYIMPTAEDVPPIHVYFEEIPFRHGGYGAKGIGELPHDGPAPAILNAIRDATGVSFTAIPLLPEDLYRRARRQPTGGGAGFAMNANGKARTDALWPAIHLTVNGEGRSVNVPPMKRLLDVLREDLHLTGTKEGCGEGECGSCSVRMNDELVNSCLVPVLQAEGADIQTVEGLALDGELTPLAGSISAQWRSAVRHLHARNVDGRGAASCAQPASQRGGNSRGAGRQFVPMYGIHAYLRVRRGRSRRVRIGAGKEPVMEQTHHAR